MGFDNHSISPPSDGVIAKNIALARNARIPAFSGMTIRDAENFDSISPQGGAEVSSKIN